MNTDERERRLRQIREALEPCWCRTGTTLLRIESNIDHGHFGCRERGRYVYCSNCWAHGPTFTTDKEAAEGWNQSRARVRADGAAPVVDMVDLIPSNWLDPLLSGPDKVIGEYPFGCPDIERLLNAIRERIRTASSGMVSREASNANP